MIKEDVICETKEASESFNAIVGAIVTIDEWTDAKTQSISVCCSIFDDDDCVSMGFILDADVLQKALAEQKKRAISRAKNALKKVSDELEASV